jgi:hypothetical protein
MKIFIMRLLFMLILIISKNVTASIHIQHGDKSFAEMRYQEAIKFYLLDSNNWDAQWRIARAYICITDICPPEDKKRNVLKAEHAAGRCIALNYNNSSGHTFLAAALGNRALFEGSRTKVKLCNTIKKELLIAISLNPRDDIAYSVLGSFYRVLAGVNWFERGLAEAFLGGLPAGGFKEGEMALRKAIEIDPQSVRHWDELGLLYKDWKKQNEEMQAFRVVCKLKPQVSSDYKRQERAKKFLTIT